MVEQDLEDLVELRIGLSNILFAICNPGRFRSKKSVTYVYAPAAFLKFSSAFDA